MVRRTKTIFVENGDKFASVEKVQEEIEKMEIDGFEFITAVSQGVGASGAAGMTTVVTTPIILFFREVESTKADE